MSIVAKPVLSHARFKIVGDSDIESAIGANQHVDVVELHYVERLREAGRAARVVPCTALRLRAAALRSGLTRRARPSTPVLRTFAQDDRGQARPSTESVPSERQRVEGVLRTFAQGDSALDFHYDWDDHWAALAASVNGARQSPAYVFLYRVNVANGVD